MGYQLLPTALARTARCRRQRCEVRQGKPPRGACKTWEVSVSIFARMLLTHLSRDAVWGAVWCEREGGGGRREDTRWQGSTGDVMGGECTVEEVSMPSSSMDW